MIKIYGIPNCDTIKKARRWLDSHNVEYTFHDYKKSGVPDKKLKKWEESVGWETLLNRRGTTWQKLDDKIKSNISAKSALKVMFDNPSAIKRPILESGKKLLVGFNEKDYEEIIG